MSSNSDFFRPVDRLAPFSVKAKPFKCPYPKCHISHETKEKSQNHFKRCHKSMCRSATKGDPEARAETSEHGWTTPPLDSATTSPGTSVPPTTPPQNYPDINKMNQGIIEPTTMQSVDHQYHANDLYREIHNEMMLESAFVTYPRFYNGPYLNSAHQPSFDFAYPNPSLATGALGKVSLYSEQDTSSWGGCVES